MKTATLLKIVETFCDYVAIIGFFFSIFLIAQLRLHRIVIPVDLFVGLVIVTIISIVPKLICFRCRKRLKRQALSRVNKKAANQ